MDDALVVGGTRFIGRHLVDELLEGGYAVTLLNRGNHPIPEGVDHVEGDRTNREDLERAREESDPDVVFDMVAFSPDEVREAVRTFDGGERYVFVSSTDAYDPGPIPKREGETPLRPCTAEQAADDSMDTYGNRKAECDRIVFEAAADGADALILRPTAVYGPEDYTERFDYWVDRVNRYDRVVLPGDARSMPMALAYVEDVARALRVVAEEGEAGEAYNVADRSHLTFRELVGRIADVAGTSVEAVHASDRELAGVGLAYDDFPLCRPRPYLVETAKLAALGWDSTPFAEGVEPTVAEHLRSDRDGARHDPGRDAEAELLGTLEGGTRLGG